MKVDAQSSTTNVWAISGPAIAHAPPGSASRAPVSVAVSVPTRDLLPEPETGTDDRLSRVAAPSESCAGNETARRQVRSQGVVRTRDGRRPVIPTKEESVLFSGH